MPFLSACGRESEAWLMTLRWVRRFGDSRDVPEVDAFLADIVEVCKRHKMSLAHEDRHGGFEVEQLSDANINWLLDATDARQERGS
jgi:hypothetical protein